jgi:hypothetical protein
VNASLRFLPGDSGGLVRLPVDDPTNALAGPPVDVGGSDDFTIDLWVRALPGENAAGPIACGANDNWKLGNILLTDGVLAERVRVSIVGAAAFGVTGPSSTSLTLCGTTDVTDGAWHLVTVSQPVGWCLPDGAMWLFVDGQLQALEAAGPGGDVSYPDAAPRCPRRTVLVVGTDKFVAGSPGFVGWVDELRFSNIVRTKISFAPPAAPFVPDPNTLALFRFDEGGGDVIYDTSGYET